MPTPPPPDRVRAACPPLSSGWPRWRASLLLGVLAGCAGRSSGGGDSEFREPAPPTASVAAPTVDGVPAPTPPAATDAPATPTDGRLDHPPENLPDDYLAFARACERGTREITIAAVGDVLIHRELQKQAFAAPEHFGALWSGVRDLIAQADVSYANLEGPTAYGIDRWGKERTDPGMVFDNKVYSGYARFNYHPTLVADLVAAGFDIVSTANNHSLDRGPLGIDRTIEALVAANLPYTGTRRQGDAKAPWHAVTQVQGINIAWLACTLHTNYEQDEQGQVLRCFDDPKAVPRMVAALVERPDIDAVIVTPHWGKEYVHEPIEKQRALAQAALDAGALAVIGNHPHVLQPWEMLPTPDGREGFAMFSLGNFVSHQRDLPRRSSVVLYLGLTQGQDGQVWLNGARYVPITVRMEGEKEAFFAEPVTPEQGPADVFAHVSGLMGVSNRLPQGAPLRTNPQCYADWATPSD